MRTTMQDLFEVGDTVYDRWHPEIEGVVKRVFKTKLHVHFEGFVTDEIYDLPHARAFLSKKLSPLEKLKKDFQSLIG